MRNENENFPGKIPKSDLRWWGFFVFFTLGVAMLGSIGCGSSGNCAWNNSNWNECNWQ